VDHVERVLLEEGPHAPGRDEHPHPVVGAIGSDVHDPREAEGVRILQRPGRGSDDRDLVAAGAQGLRQLERVVLDPTPLGQVIGNDLANTQPPLQFHADLTRKGKGRPTSPERGC
jgi:hypothetical protein